MEDTAVADLEVAAVDLVILEICNTHTFNVLQQKSRSIADQIGIQPRYGTRTGNPSQPLSINQQNIRSENMRIQDRFMTKLKSTSTNSKTRDQNVRRCLIYSESA